MLQLLVVDESKNLKVLNDNKSYNFCYKSIIDKKEKEQINPVLKDLHWLPIEMCIQHKILCITYFFDNQSGAEFWRHSSFLQTVVHISNFIESTNFMLMYFRHMVPIYNIIYTSNRVQMTLTETGGHRWRSKVRKINKWSYMYLVNYYTHRHFIWYQNTIQ